MSYPKGSKEKLKFYNKWLAEHGDLSCYLCGEHTSPHYFDAHPNKTTPDHKVALSKGGSNKKENLAICCWGCNQKKKNESVESFKKEMV